MWNLAISEQSFNNLRLLRMSFVNNLSINYIDNYIDRERRKMKNNLFHKATALAISSLVVFSGQALAIASNHQKYTKADESRDSEIFIAQVTACAQVKFAVEVLGQTITGVETVENIVKIKKLKEIPPELRPEIEKSLQESIDTMAEAVVIAEQEKNSKLVFTLTTVISVLENVAQAIAEGKVGQLEVLNGAKADAENGCQFQ